MAGEKGKLTGDKCPQCGGQIVLTGVMFNHGMIEGAECPDCRKLFYWYSEKGVKAGCP